MTKAKPAAPVKPASSKRAAPAVKRSTDIKASKKTPKPRVSKPPIAVATPSEKASAKLERGRFTLPVADFAKIKALKTRARDLGRPTRKNELFRVGLALLSALSDESLVIALDQLESTRKKARRVSDLDNRDS